jgi:hypothetical protein
MFVVINCLLLTNFGGENMVKKNVLVIALIFIVAAIVGLMFVSCASSGAAASPDKDEAIALYNEVKALRAEFLKQGKDVTQEPYGRAEGIYALSELYIEKKMYTEALPGLGQAKTYYTGFLK